MRTLLCALALAFAATSAVAAPPTPLFASDQPIRLTIRAPIASLVSKRNNSPRAGTLSLTGMPESYPVTLSVRGITRRQSDVCQFPPLRVDFNQPPPAASLFAGQRRLKLVTHCRPSADFQQKVLLEYAAYRLYNVLTPLSFRARLATIDYVDDSGRPYVTRTGFFIEDFDDVARRNTMVKAATADRVPLAQLEPRAAARFALFNYMISNLDWSMRAGPVGEGCCHNGRLLAASRAPGAVVTAVPYDFDFSGLVDAPYAEPPEGINVRSVRERVYRGYCAHAAQARVEAADIAGKRAQLIGTLATIPGLEERTRARAAAYLDGFFRDIDSGRVFSSCVG